MSMSKRHKALDDSQLKLKLEIFETLERARTMAVEGSLNIQAQIKGLISQGLKRSPLSRYQIAAQISELTGQEVTKWQLDSWTAESKEGHRPPMEILPAFCRATGAYDLLRFLCEKAGCYMIEGEDILLTELGRLQKMRNELRAKEREIGEYLDKIGAKETP